MSILVFILGQAVALLGGTQVHGGEPAQAATQKYVDAETAQRLYRITKPLLGAMDHSLGPRQVSIGIVADDAINAANGGGGKFLVTTGLLARANDEQLRGVMAHEIAHEILVMSPS
ncbi:MAG: M48 family metalloprotease [Candidatus Binatia bacterium]